MKSEGKIVVVMMFGLQAFQFNSKYLLAIHDHVYSSQFGTFIGNCQKEREVNTQYLSLKKYLYSILFVSDPVDSPCLVGFIFFSSAESRGYIYYNYFTEIIFPHSFWKKLFPCLLKLHDIFSSVSYPLSVHL